MCVIVKKITQIVVIVMISFIDDNRTMMHFILMTKVILDVLRTEAKQELYNIREDLKMPRMMHLRNIYMILYSNVL